MENTFIKQWQDMNQASLDAFKKLASGNTEASNGLFNAQAVPANFAEFMKMALASTRDLREFNSNAFNTLLQKQLSIVDLQSSATAVKSLGEISQAAVSGFVQSQTATLVIYMESTAHYLEELKKAKTAEDVIAAQTALFAELQDKLKTNTEQTLELLGSVKTGLNAWAETTLNSVSKK
ncbi:hypothetical protein [Beggiatoa leptomitoformis]|uniref:Phasin domain-containing protein n=1 Tax=Beggiatoa leptomitoformis TaxID=288004 RepID=A0A2N9YFW4_9GAMM|nr:hypothetical protein [Beggiatoa leptomitoformis]ALG68308.1 hypothetical protein AL038_12050 [Beggiatoa leptomitoformis]AUI69377.1 hypothetical protein BLE401_12215 [Beggiatoa leptomitoformis]